MPFAATAANLLSGIAQTNRRWTRARLDAGTIGRGPRWTRTGWTRTGWRLRPADHDPHPPPSPGARPDTSITPAHKTAQIAIFLSVLSHALPVDHAVNGCKIACNWHNKQALPITCIGPRFANDLLVFFGVEFGKSLALVFDYQGAPVFQAHDEVREELILRGL